MKIDLNPNRANYYTQTNNELDPNISCQGTATVQCLDIIFKHDLRQIEILTPYGQPEDDLRKYIFENADVQAFFKRSHPGSAIPAPEWADVLVFAINKIYGRIICSFEGNMTPAKIKTDISCGLPVMVSMRYWRPSRIPGHYISVVGFDGENLIIDDPYKNFLLNQPDGYHCIYEPDNWQKHSKGYGIRFNS